MQAWHLMQIPETSLLSAGEIAPIGQTAAHWPHWVHFDASTKGFAFRNLAGVPSMPRGVSEIDGIYLMNFHGEISS